MTTNFVVGVDFGLPHEPPSLAVLERRHYTPPPPIGLNVLNAPDPTVPEYICRHLDSLPPDASNGTVAQQVQRMLQASDALRGAHVIVNEGPVGPAVVDLLRRTVATRVWRTAVTNGAKADRSSMPFNVPRRDLLMLLQTLLNEGRCTFARNRYADALVEQMKTVTIKPPTTNDELAWREQQHDGLVFAVAMACWLFENVTLDRRTSTSVDLGFHW